MDTLLSLRVFAAVAEHKSFAYVAESMSLSATMTSKHVQHVEARVGARLLNRNSRNVSITEAGALYLETVKPLLMGLDQAEGKLSEATLAPNGNLKVSVPVWMANSIFVKTIAAYHEENPHVVLNLDLSGRKVNMVEDGIDLALRVATTLDEGLIARKLAQVNFNLVASPDFLARHGRPKSVDDLNGAPFIAYNQIASNGHVRIGRNGSAIDIKFSTVMETGNETLIHLALREGMGFAMLPHWLTNQDLADGVLESVLPDVVRAEVPLCAIYPDRTYLPAKVRSFLDFLAGPNGLDSKMP